MIVGTIFLALLVIALVSIVKVEAHGRWKCPGPRDALDESGKHITFDNTGNKYAACGPESGKWGFGTVTTLKPGWNTITWEESVSHAGSPFRLAILDETETARIVLLDHIPHNDESSPTSHVEKTYVPYRVSVNIPDVQCDKCSLQLLYVMTDKSTKCGIETCYYNPADAACKGSTDPNAATCTGAPNSNVCVQEGECFSNYHSCTDVVITGTRPISDFDFDQQPADWTYKNLTMSRYTSEVGKWSNSWLSDVPSKYTTDYKTLAC
mmetsp:Transcript_21890/g.23858  ORF Transcript_21890/g.23858 Transcript_21890/m.23858 type:complete len:266 (-) Transcript_21890:195-992(-)